jgi:hypothetical protein
MSDSDSLIETKKCKRELIYSTLADVSLKKKAYFKKMGKLKKLDDGLEAFITGCGAISVSSLIATITVLNPITLIIGAVFTTISTVVGAVKRVYNIQGSYESCKTTYNQLSDLERESRAVLVRNHLESRDLQNLLDDINNRLSLIEDTSIPITL